MTFQLSTLRTFLVNAGVLHSSSAASEHPLSQTEETLFAHHLSFFHQMEFNLARSATHIHGLLPASVTAVLTKIEEEFGMKSVSPKVPVVPPAPAPAPDPAPADPVVPPAPDLVPDVPNPQNSQPLAPLQTPAQPQGNQISRNGQPQFNRGNK